MKVEKKERKIGDKTRRKIIREHNFLREHNFPTGTEKTCQKSTNF